MNHRAMLAAVNHLELAQAAVDKMALAEGFKGYDNGWAEFLSQASRIHNKLEQGAKGCNESSHWFGLRKHQRRTDPLLRYIHYARDCAEHSLDFTAAMVADRIVGDASEAKGGLKMSALIMVDEMGRMHVRDATASDGEGRSLPMEFVNARPTLVKVRSRAGTFEPPLMHLDAPIVDSTPLGVARLGLAYLTGMVEEARSLPFHS